MTVETQKASESFCADDAYITSACVSLANACHMTKRNISGVRCALLGGRGKLHLNSPGCYAPLIGCGREMINVSIINVLTEFQICILLT